MNKIEMLDIVIQGIEERKGTLQAFMCNIMDSERHQLDAHKKDWVEFQLWVLEQIPDGLMEETGLSRKQLTSGRQAWWAGDEYDKRIDFLNKLKDKLGHGQKKKT